MAKRTTRNINKTATAKPAAAPPAKAQRPPSARQAAKKTGGVAKPTTARAQRGVITPAAARAAAAELMSTPAAPTKSAVTLGPSSACPRRQAARAPRAHVSRGLSLILEAAVKDEASTYTSEPDVGSDAPATLNADLAVLLDNATSARRPAALQAAPPFVAVAPLSYSMHTGEAVYHAQHPSNGLLTHATWEGILSPDVCEWVAQETVRRHAPALLAAAAAAAAAMQQAA